MTTATATEPAVKEPAKTQGTPPATKANKKKVASRPRPPLDDKGLRAEEKKLRTKYPQIVGGTLRNCGQDPDAKLIWKTKRTIEIRCGGSKCKNRRRVATSDLHQVAMCEECTTQSRLQRKRDARAAARKAKQEKPK